MLKGKQEPKSEGCTNTKHLKEGLSSALCVVKLCSGPFIFLSSLTQAAQDVGRHYQGFSMQHSPRHGLMSHQTTYQRFVHRSRKPHETVPLASHISGIIREMFLHSSAPEDMDAQHDNSQKIYFILNFLLIILDIAVNNDMHWCCCYLCPVATLFLHFMSGPGL